MTNGVRNIRLRMPYVYDAKDLNRGRIAKSPAAAAAAAVRLSNPFTTRPLNTLLLRNRFYLVTTRTVGDGFTRLATASTCSPVHVSFGKLGFLRSYARGRPCCSVTVVVAVRTRCVR